jgi:hypothetical protein
MRANTINAQDIWNASNLKESKKLLAALNKEIKKIKAWHGWAQSAEDLKVRIANGEEAAWECTPNTRLEDLLIEAETNRDEWEADNKDGMIR